METIPKSNWYPEISDDVERCSARPRVDYTQSKSYRRSPDVPRVAGCSAALEGCGMHRKMDNDVWSHMEVMVCDSISLLTAEPLRPENARSECDISLLS